MADDLGTLQPIGAFPKQGSARRSHPRGSAGPNVPSASLRPHLPDRFDRSEDCWNPIATMKNSCTNLSENHKSGSSCDCSQNDRTEEKKAPSSPTPQPPHATAGLGNWALVLGVTKGGARSSLTRPPTRHPSVGVWCLTRTGKCNGRGAGSGPWLRLLFHAPRVARSARHSGRAFAPPTDAACLSRSARRGWTEDVPDGSPLLRPFDLTQPSQLHTHASVPYTRSRTL